MAAQQHKSGKPWSGQNKIPNIQEFVSGLDKDKAQRDKEIDSQVTSSNQQDKVIAHKNEKREEKGTTVTDPVTGRQVVIADVGKKYMKNVDNPQVRSSQL